MTSTEQGIVPVILSGGGGSRLWPASRQDRPKQFLPLVNGETTFSNALARVSDQQLFAPPVIVTANNLAFLAADELEAAGLHGRIVLEPVRRDSAPAIAVAAHIVLDYAPESLMLVLAADHFISDTAAFRQTVREGVQAAEAGYIVTFGIKPGNASPNYGYIEAAESIGASAFKVSRFIEKPDTSKAQGLLAKGCLWNSGNLLLRPHILLQELERYEPGILEAVRQAVGCRTFKTLNSHSLELLDEAAFASSPAKSIDFAVMERTSRAAVVPAPYGWSDLGSWNALWEVHAKDENGNVTSGDVTLAGTRNSYVASEGIHTAVVGLEDIVLVATRDAVLAAPRAVGAELKTLLERLQQSAGTRHLAESHAHLKKPWGNETRITSSERLQLWLLTIEPGAGTDRIKYRGGGMHWIIIQGTATLKTGAQQSSLRTGQVHVSLGQDCRISNEESNQLQVLEVRIAGEPSES